MLLLMDTAVPEATAAVRSPEPHPVASTWRLPRRAETALWLLGLVAVAGLAYGWYVAHGGLYSDDWALMSDVVHPAKGGWWDAVQALWDRASYRPLSVAYYPVVFGILGGHATLNLLWSLAVTVVFVALLFGVLRAVGTKPVHAFAVAALVLVTSTGDSVVLWPAATPIRFAGTLYLAGLLLALGGIDRPDARRSWRRHLLALVFYLGAIWTYELTAALTAAGLLVYLAVAPPRRALTRWAADMAVAIPAMYWVLSRTPKHVQDLSHQYNHAKMIVHQLWDMYGGIAFPSWLPGKAAGPLTIAVGIAAVALVVLMWRGVARGPAAAEARRWAITGAVAFVYTMAAYVVFVPADFYYSPAAVNFGNRVNGVGIAPLVLLAYAAVMVVAALAFYRRPQWLRAAVGVGLAYALAMFFTHNSALKTHQELYVQAYRGEVATLDLIRQQVPAPRDGTLILTTGVPPTVAVDLPIFYSTWDLKGAVRDLYDNPRLDAYNAFNGLQCTPQNLVAPGGPSGTYGATVLVDMTRRRAWPISSAKRCTAVMKVLQSPPG
jgi:hypothetical protein